MPFGGRKNSSDGPRGQGRRAAEFYTTVKTAHSLSLNESYVPKTRAGE